jgi:hypothetical protein
VLGPALAIVGYLKPREPDHVTITNTLGMHGASIAAGSAVINGTLNIAGHRVPTTRGGAEIPIVELHRVWRGGSLS